MRRTSMVTHRRKFRNSRSRFCEYCSSHDGTPPERRRLRPSLAAVQAGDGRRNRPDTRHRGRHQPGHVRSDRPRAPQPAGAGRGSRSRVHPRLSAFRPRRPAVHHGHDLLRGVRIGSERSAGSDHQRVAQELHGRSGRGTPIQIDAMLVSGWTPRCWGRRHRSGEPSSQTTTGPGRGPGSRCEPQLLDEDVLGRSRRHRAQDLDAGHLLRDHRGHAAGLQRAFCSSRRYLGPASRRNGPGVRLGSQSLQKRR